MSEALGTLPCGHKYHEAFRNGKMRVPYRCALYVEDLLPHTTETGKSTFEQFKQQRD